MRFRILYPCFKSWKSGLLISCVFVALLVSCRQDDNPPLAEFDGGVVLQNEYIQHYLLSTQYKPEEYPKEGKLREIVSSKAIEKMAVFEAEARNLPASPLYAGMSSRTRRKLLYYRYVRQEMIDAVVTDSVITAFYEPIGTFVSASIIARDTVDVIRVPRGAIRGADELIFVGDDNRIEIRSVDILRTDAQYAYLQSGAEDGERISLTTIEAPSNGMMVRASDDIPDDAPEKEEGAEKLISGADGD